MGGGGSKLGCSPRERVFTNKAIGILSCFDPNATDTRLPVLLSVTKMSNLCCWLLSVGAEVAKTSQQKEV